MREYLIKYRMLVIGLILFLGWTPEQSVHAKDRSAIRKEERADRRFMNQNFDKAMILYEKAISIAASKQLQASLHIKSARLYYMLRRYPEAILHFGDAMNIQQSSLDVNDVCEFVNALRFLKQDKQAETVCLRYAYQDVYSRNQCYTNSLEALSMRHVPTSDIEYEVANLIDCNTPGAEYWIGILKGQVFYARSSNRFNDPDKRFFHDTKLFPIAKSAKSTSEYDGKKVDGPFVFFNNGYKISTMVEKKSKRKITMESGELNPYITKLLITGGKRKEQNTHFINLFPQEKDYSYCHPFLLEDDRVLLFASDMPGGYGGYDLYIVRWDERMGLWEDPVNLGPEINTSGNEIYPSYYNGKMYFASNGQPGYGGYDLYSFDYDQEDENFIPGSLNHLPSPINSAFNDFCLLPMDEIGGYFVSDRNLTTGDDIYTYHRVEKDPVSHSSFFGMSEHAAMMGGQVLLIGTLEKRDNRSVKYVSIQTKEIPTKKKEDETHKKETLQKPKDKVISTNLEIQGVSPARSSWKRGRVNHNEVR